MIDPSSVSVQEQRDKIEKNSEHVIKSLNFAMKKLQEYYKDGAELNGMSYNAFLMVYNAINDSLEKFESINNRITDNVMKKPEKQTIIPRRFHTTKNPD